MQASSRFRLLLVLCLASACVLGCAKGTRNAQLSIESRTLSPRGSDEQGVHLMLNQRVTAPDRFVLIGREVLPDGGVIICDREFDYNGTPLSSTQEGAWDDRWNRLETLYSRNGAQQHINEATNSCDIPAATFQDPTLLWFWHTQPTPGESVVVTYLTQNTIATSQIRYTYEGTDELTLVGRTLRAHRVREDPLNAPGVYTLWWYDEQGMGIKRFHKTTHREFTEELVAWK